MRAWSVLWGGVMAGCQTLDAEPAGWQDTVAARVAVSARQPRMDADTAALGGEGAWSARLAPDGRTSVALAARDWLSPFPNDVAIGVRTASIGRRGALRTFSAEATGIGGCAPGPEVDAEGQCLRRAERVGDGASEWFVHAGGGVEHGWTLDEPPRGAGPVVINVVFDGVRAIDVVDDGARAVLRTGGADVEYGALAAWDADGDALPARMVPHPGGVRVEVEDAGARWPITVDPLITTAAWTAEGNQANAHFGISAVGVGDVNQDGYDDVVVGAYLFDNGETDEGKAFLYLGGASGLSTTSSWSFEPNVASTEFGRAVAPAGDVNGDGYLDVIIGAPIEAGSGRARVFTGGPAGLSASPVWTVLGDQASSRYGHSVSTAGDVNNDGYADIVVGAQRYDAGQTDEGRAYVYHGSASGPATSASWTAEANSATGWFGTSVAAAGDPNGDGFGDVIIGGSAYSNGQASEGAAWLYHGSNAGLEASAAWFKESNESGTSFGASVAGVGDVNADGYGDVVIGAPLRDQVFGDNGDIFLYLGSSQSLATTATGSFTQFQSNGRFGSAVAGAGDVNGDGYADVLVGSTQWDTTQGRAWLFFGFENGMESTPDWTLDFDVNDTQLGMSVASAGDVNGDGLSDVIVGGNLWDNGQTNEGGAWLYYGQRGSIGTTVVATKEPDVASAAMGVAAASAGDLNADGYDDVVYGAYGYNSGGTINEGMVSIHLGGPTGLGAASLRQSDQTGALMGLSAGRAGDVDGDGFGDLLISTPYWDGGQTDEGRVEIYFGGLGGAGSSAGWIMESNQASARFGYAASAAGDVNGDGYDDVLIGAPNYAAGEANEGRAFLYLSGPSGLANTPAWTTEANQVGANLGHAVMGLGDLNGDGYDDVAIGAPSFTNTLTGQGRVTVYLGSASGLSTTPSQTLYGTATNANFGWSVAMAGDLNLDGRADLAVGSPGTGAAYVFSGAAGGVSTTPSWSQVVGSNQFGYALGTTGDVNSDGYPDLAVGAPQFSNGQGNEGAFYVYLGGSSGLSTTAAFTTESNNNNGQLGAAIGVADVNGDGVGDVIVGAPGFSNGQTTEGRGFVYYGNGTDSPSAGRRGLPARMKRVGASTPIAPRGAAEGAFDLIVNGARTPYGRTGMKLEVEVKPLGTAFDGTGTVLASTWTIAAVPGATLVESITGLTANTRYRWRARLRIDPADGVPTGRTPWVSGGLEGLATQFHVRVLGLPDADGDGDPDNTDCNDANAAVHQGATEVCNTIDDDCDGLVDEGGVCDADGDGVVDSLDPAPSDPRVCGDGDADTCDDCRSFDVHPDADGADRDRDGLCDAGDPDRDGDGLANAADPRPDDPMNSGPDNCPNDARKSSVGVCGCGYEDVTVLAGTACVAWTATTHPSATFGHLSRMMAQSWVDAATVDGGATVGQHARVGASALVGADAVVGRRSFVGPGAEVGVSSTISPDVEVGANAEIGAFSVLGYGSRVQAGGRVGPTSVLGSLSDVGVAAACGVEPGGTGGCRLARDATIGDGADVSSDANLGAGSAIGANAQVGVGLTARADAVVGADATVGEACRLGRSSEVGVAAGIADRTTLRAAARVADGACVTATDQTLERGTVWSVACP
jgi:UDP-3-O-[3-hydroxymyristoyl] glucosamine N-acyltransferase